MIHKNESLSESNKFTYLKSFLSDSAKSTISGLLLLSRNYKRQKQPAIGVLIRRCSENAAILQKDTHGKV